MRSLKFLVQFPRYLRKVTLVREVHRQTILSSAIRLGRLTGAHFNIKGKADREVAEQVLNLTEYLIRYFYVLSSDATELETKINALGDKGLSEDI